MVVEFLKGDEKEARWWLLERGAECSRRTSLCNCLYFISPWKLLEFFGLILLNLFFDQIHLLCYALFMMEINNLPVFLVIAWL